MAQLLPDRGGSIADLINRLLKLLVREVQVLRPALNLMRFVHVDFDRSWKSLLPGMVHAQGLRIADINDLGRIPFLLAVEHGVFPRSSKQCGGAQGGYRPGVHDETNRRRLNTFLTRNPSAPRRFFHLPRSCGRGERPMRKLLILAAAASLAATMANAQTTTTTTTTGTGSAVVQIEPQYRTKIKSYITEHKVRPVELQEKIVVGATVPSDVELVTVPSDWGPSLTKYRYVYSDDRVVLVDPGTRTVVQVVD
jgi:hypothetical protein